MCFTSSRLSLMNVASASRPELARDDAVEDDGVSGYYDQRCRDGRTGSSRAGQRIGTAVVVVARRSLNGTISLEQAARSEVLSCFDARGCRAE